MNFKNFNKYLGGGFLLDYTSFDFHIIGESHIKKNVVCQDNSFSYSDENIIIAIVADGHGSPDYFRSNIGSKFAIESAFECIKNFIYNENIHISGFVSDVEGSIKKLEVDIFEKWNEKVKKDYTENSFTKEEYKKVSHKKLQNYLNGIRLECAYGTTLIAVVVTEKFYFGIQIGDGKCVEFYEDGTVKQPIPWDEKCFLNQTTSLCDKDAFLNFRHFYTEKKPIALYLCTDGVDDTYQNEEQLYDMYRRFTSNFIEEGFEKGIRQIGEFLPVLTKKGSGDDVSISGIFNIYKIRKIS